VNRNNATLAVLLVNRPKCRGRRHGDGDEGDRRLCPRLNPDADRGDRAAAAPAAPGILASPSSLSFASTNGGANPPAQSFGLTNVGSSTLNYTLSTNAPWLSVSPVTGSLAAGVGQQVTVSINNTGLQTGTSNAVITITDPAATNNPQTVNVSLVVTARRPPGPSSRSS
jgi:hypothetical protein